MARSFMPFMPLDQNLPQTFTHFGCIGFPMYVCSFSNGTMMVLLFFQIPFEYFSHILKHYHDFESIVTLFQSFLQAYTQPYSFSKKNSFHELSVAVHANHSLKKNFRFFVSLGFNFSKCLYKCFLF